MINTNIEERFKKAKKYKVPKKILDKNTKEIFADLFYAENENYSLLYSLLEDIQFSIYRKECTDVAEVEKFIRNYKDIFVCARSDFDLDEDNEV